jgi:hypothetical protein
VVVDEFMRGVRGGVVQVDCAGTESGGVGGCSTKVESGGEFPACGAGRVDGTGIFGGGGVGF